MNSLTLFLLSIVLFFIGLLGFALNRKNLLLIIFSLELSILAINFNFFIASFYLDDILGQIFGVFILTIAAAETSIGLAILIIYYRIWGTISFNQLSVLKG